MRAPVIGVLAALLLTPGPAPAQAPVVTPEGDPSVQNDTIYRLAVDPADYPDEPFVYLLDDGIVRFEADGRASKTYRYVVQVLTKESAESWGERTFSYIEGRERLRINWIRVLKPDGTVIADGPTHEQETAAPVARAYPVYTDVKIRRLSLGGVEPGVLVDYSYTTETVTPVLAGDFWSSWSVTTGRLTRRSRLIVDVPAGIEPRIEEENLDFPRRTYARDGRHGYLWATEDVPPLEGEPFAAWPNDVSMGITVSGPITWSEIAAWYAGLAQGRYEIAPELEEALGGAVKGATTLDDSLRALHRWIAQDVRYVSLSLGRGGYQPRLPAEVVATKFGDCKDKATLFIAAARRLGVTAHPVLVSLDGIVDSTMPSIAQFDHMIAAVERDAGYEYLDLTAELVPYGAIPPYLQGEVGLLVRPEGARELVTFPEDSTAANRLEVTITGELTPQGGFRGRWTQIVAGTEQYGVRSAMASSSTLTAQERERVARALANNLFNGAEGDSLELFDGRDLDAQPRLSLQVSAASVTERAGGRHIFTLPLPTYAAPGLVADLEAREPRRFPIDVAQVNSPSIYRHTLELTLPPSWRAELPDRVAVVGVFGTYRADYSQESRVLRVVREMVGRKGTEPRDSFPALVRWLEEVARDDVRYIVLETGQ